MKATGIVRRIDDLGRVVIPKEIRRTMRIREGDPLEIFTAADGEVIFKKYSPMGDFAEFTAQYAEVLGKALNMPVLITDRDRGIAGYGIKKDGLERPVTRALEEIMENRSGYVASHAQDIRLVPLEGDAHVACLAFPIIGNGDVSGCVCALFNQREDFPTQAEIKLVQVAAGFLGKQTED
ncbi:MAG: AbrB/MazE/SpoVT family DNA-binding domain-containing protein [Clostridia bacterium]|nr:AbrB/MazE/SpoVT family DNA-binding domain-containing protein [Clostridia bacterium]